MLPIKIKSGKDYYIHSALNSFLQNKDYNVSRAIVFSNERKIFTDENGITYMPIYFVSFLWWEICRVIPVCFFMGMDFCINKIIVELFIFLWKLSWKRIKTSFCVQFEYFVYLINFILIFIVATIIFNWIKNLSLNIVDSI